MQLCPFCWLYVKSLPSVIFSLLNIRTKIFIGLHFELLSSLQISDKVSIQFYFT